MEDKNDLALPCTKIAHSDVLSSAKFGLSNLSYIISFSEVFNPH
jgi:hypothetical protein